MVDRRHQLAVVVSKGEGGISSIARLHSTLGPPGLMCSTSNFGSRHAEKASQHNLGESRRSSGATSEKPLLGAWAV